MQDKQHRVQKAAAEERLSRISGRLSHSSDTYHAHMKVGAQTQMCMLCMFLHSMDYGFLSHLRITVGGVCSNREGCCCFTVQQRGAALPLSWKPYPRNAH